MDKIENFYLPKKLNNVLQIKNIFDNKDMITCLGIVFKDILCTKKINIDSVYDKKSLKLLYKDIKNKIVEYLSDIKKEENFIKAFKVALKNYKNRNFDIVEF